MWQQRCLILLRNLTPDAHPRPYIYVDLARRQSLTSVLTMFKEPFSQLLWAVSICVLSIVIHGIIEPYWNQTNGTLWSRFGRSGGKESSTNLGSDCVTRQRLEQISWPTFVCGQPCCA